MADGRPVSGGGYGKQLKDDYRRFYGANVGFAGRGEMIPNENSYCEIDPAVVDRWGIPVLRFHWKWSDHELKQVKHMQETFRAIIHEMGGTPMSPMPTAEQQYGIAAGGRIIHEVGCVRMGRDPKTSVLNSNCQAHDCRNLFVTDGGPVRHQPGQKRDVDHPGASDAHERVHRDSTEGRKHMKRRDVLKILLALRRRHPGPMPKRCRRRLPLKQRPAAGRFVPKFFTPTEFKLVSVLADIVIPKDERSGSAPTPACRSSWTS